jgi:hypothetical protein
LVTQHSFPNSDWDANLAKAKASLTDQSKNCSFTNPIANFRPRKFANLSSNSASDLRNLSRKQTNTISNSTSSTSAQTQANATKPSTTKPHTPPTPSVSLPNNETATNNHVKVTDNHTKQVSAKTDTQEYKLDELLSVSNKLIRFTAQYQGKVVLTN